MTLPRPIRILLVDDDPADVLLTKERLAASKIRNDVDAVHDGEQALSYLRQEGEYADAPRPDVILLDLNMPVMGGHEFLDVAKNDPDLQNIPVVVVTTSDEDRDIVESYRLHANAYVTKPVGLDQFARVVDSIESFWFQVVRLPGGD